MNDMKKKHGKSSHENGGQEPLASAEATETPVQTSAPDDGLAALNEKYLRLMAEYDNYRKRSLRDIEAAARASVESVLREMLPILDNLDRATEHRCASSIDDYVAGIALIEDQLRTLLNRAGLEPMTVVGTPFDPALHDAILQIDSPDAKPGVVVTEVQKGYLLGGNVLRHAKVVVSK